MAQLSSGTSSLQTRLQVIRISGTDNTMYYQPIQYYTEFVCFQSDYIVKSFLDECTCDKSEHISLYFSKKNEMTSLK